MLAAVMAAMTAVRRSAGVATFAAGSRRDLQTQNLVRDEALEPSLLGLRAQ
jgi:hypothetical protein